MRCHTQRNQIDEYIKIIIFICQYFKNTWTLHTRCYHIQVYQKNTIFQSVEGCHTINSKKNQTNMLSNILLSIYSEVLVKRKHLLLFLSHSLDRSVIQMFCIFLWPVKNILSSTLHLLLNLSHHHKWITISHTKKRLEIISCYTPKLYQMYKSSHYMHDLVN